jgi:hypothetical protein|tara:strand:+ start:924 stop:1310 length:387 start_codon:yes stop_codon:yes gene_type:complete
MAQYEDITIDKGSDVTIRLDLYNIDGSPKQMNIQDSDLNFVPIYNVNAKMKKTYNTKDSDATTFFATTVDPDNLDYVIHLSLTNTQTDLLKPGRYVYDVEISRYDSNESATIVERILEGNIQVTPSVS